MQFIHISLSLSITSAYQNKSLASDSLEMRLSRLDVASIWSNLRTVALQEDGHDQLRSVLDRKSCQHLNSLRSRSTTAVADVNGSYTWVQLHPPLPSSKVVRHAMTRVTQSYGSGRRGELDDKAR